MFDDDGGPWATDPDKTLVRLGPNPEGPTNCSWRTVRRARFLIWGFELTVWETALAAVTEKAEKGLVFDLLLWSGSGLVFCTSQSTFSGELIFDMADSSSFACKKPLDIYTEDDASARTSSVSLGSTLDSFISILTQTHLPYTSIVDEQVPFLSRTTACDAVDERDGWRTSDTFEAPSV